MQIADWNTSVLKLESSREPLSSNGIRPTDSQEKLGLSLDVMENTEGTSSTNPLSPSLSSPSLSPLSPSRVTLSPFSLGESKISLADDSLNLNEFIHCPAPQGEPILCRVLRRRTRSSLYPVYEMYREEEDGCKTLLLTAMKCMKSTTSYYRIMVPKSNSKCGKIVGKVRSNFIGTAFVVYDHGRSPKCKMDSGSTLDAATLSQECYGSGQLREELCGVIYEPNILGFKGPRKMTVLLNGMSKAGVRLPLHPIKKEDSLISQYRNCGAESILALRNKSPQWNEDTMSYVLNFNGRVTLASVKNFQIVHEDDVDYTVMQFGRVSYNAFTLDYSYPLCALQAFGIALTSFDAKIVCE